MASAFEQLVAETRARTEIPGAAAGLLRDGVVELAADGVLALGRPEPVRPETPFRIASITKSFTATLVAASGPLDERTRALLSHTAGLRPEAHEPLPEPCRGLWSYSNAGYWQAAASLEAPFEAAMRERVLEPLGLAATGFDEPPGAARGHVQAGETGHRLVAADTYLASRRPSGGLWSTVGDLVRYGREHCRGFAELHEPHAEALGARYALGWWVRDGVLDHEGSVAGYQSLLLLVPERELVLAVLTNSWRGSGLVRRLVERLELVRALPSGGGRGAEPGRYALDGFDATVDGTHVHEREVDPVTGEVMQRRYPVSGDAPLMSWRTDSPRPGVARIGWVALPRVAP